MEISSDYEDLFKILNRFKIKYLVVGAYAVSYYAAPRFTKDLDIWIIPDMNEAGRIYRALKTFGAPLREICPDDFLDKNMIYQIGVAPVRIDILTHLPGVPFKQAWKNRKRCRFGGTPIQIVGIRELIRAKKIAGRPQDLLDLANLNISPVRKKRHQKDFQAALDKANRLHGGTLRKLAK
ncbi:MAG: hypothetical protein A3G34_02695 [Candidatus Lindowbacteria bacterium RIFCSPLOWO2_12_FULL_62_27]|nr:MAG: hypothetical protein A3I06_06345 [Candidatus Lindowbacteria bacterium RIFCSPLOWO2_02_FULL_62_12]OGH59209.1 MAG: hypothetical protein A3G34_02695 [Candidatus Lindowbacteria bacterium RIFCSPLOWO2_12_FULL_62_27]